MDHLERLANTKTPTNIMPSNSDMVKSTHLIVIALTCGGSRSAFRILGYVMVGWIAKMVLTRLIVNALMMNSNVVGVNVEVDVQQKLLPPINAFQRRKLRTAFLIVHLC